MKCHPRHPVRSTDLRGDGGDSSFRFCSGSRDLEESALLTLTHARGWTSGVHDRLLLQSHGNSPPVPDFWLPAGRVPPGSPCSTEPVMDTQVRTLPEWTLLTILPGQCRIYSRVDAIVGGRGLPGSQLPGPCTLSPIPPVGPDLSKIPQSRVETPESPLGLRGRSQEIPGVFGAPLERSG